MYCIDNSIFVSSLPSCRLSDVAWAAPVRLYKQVKSSAPVSQCYNYRRSLCLRLYGLHCYMLIQGSKRSLQASYVLGITAISGNLHPSWKLFDCVQWKVGHDLNSSSDRGSSVQKATVCIKGKNPQFHGDGLALRRWVVPLRCFVTFYICIGWSRCCGSCSWRNPEQGYTGSFKCRGTFVSQWQLQVHSWWPACHRSCCEADLQVRFCISIDVG